LGPGIPGIALFLLLILFLMFIGVAIVAGLASLIAVMLKVKIKPRDIGLVAVLFLLCFSISSVFVRAREDGVIEGFFGDPARYEGAHLFYGLPEIWMRRFVPYNESYSSLFLLPDNYYFIGFFVDFTFWLAVAVVIMYAVRFYSSKRASERLRI